MLQVGRTLKGAVGGVGVVRHCCGILFHCSTTPNYRAKVIQTTGPCNFGKLNYYLGVQAAKRGEEVPYSSIDFCKDPEIICSSAEFQELKWVAGMFYWIESIQEYNVGGWSYMDELRKFVDGNFQDRTFIDSVSGIVNRGCHNPPCGTGPVDGGHERYNNFLKILKAFKLLG